MHRRPLVPWRATVEEVNDAVQKELDASGANLGYRRIWASLKRQKILVRKDDVRNAILELNAEGFQKRKRRKLVRRKNRNPDPNYVWHIDGHNKLKPFGFPVHGCIDGFPRKLIWLEVTSSNKVPEIISQYYLKAVKRLKGVPKKNKADDGTEHSLTEPVHIYLRSLNDDTGHALNSFSLVSSPVNQRIESYWSKFLVDRPGWWKSFFQDMVDLEIFDPSEPALLDCIRFCFMSILQKELTYIANEWNRHLLSPN